MGVAGQGQSVRPAASAARAREMVPGPRSADPGPRGSEGPQGNAGSWHCPKAGETVRVAHTGCCPSATQPLAPARGDADQLSRARAAGPGITVAAGQRGRPAASHNGNLVAAHGNPSLETQLFVQTSSPPSSALCSRLPLLVLPRVPAAPLQLPLGCQESSGASCFVVRSPLPALFSGQIAPVSRSAPGAPPTGRPRGQKQAGGCASSTGACGCKRDPAHIQRKTLAPSQSPAPHRTAGPSWPRGCMPGTPGSPGPCIQHQGRGPAATHLG